MKPINFRNNLDFRFDLAQNRRQIYNAQPAGGENLPVSEAKKLLDSKSPEAQKPEASKIPALESKLSPAEIEAARLKTLGPEIGTIQDARSELDKIKANLPKPPTNPAPKNTPDIGTRSPEKPDEGKEKTIKPMKGSEVVAYLQEAEAKDKAAGMSPKAIVEHAVARMKDLTIEQAKIGNIVHDGWTEVELGKVMMADGREVTIKTQVTNGPIRIGTKNDSFAVPVDGETAKLLAEGASGGMLMTLEVMNALEREAIKHGKIIPFISGPQAAKEILSGKYGAQMKKDLEALDDPKVIGSSMRWIDLIQVRNKILEEKLKQNQDQNLNGPLWGPSKTVIMNPDMQDSGTTNQKVSLRQSLSIAGGLTLENGIYKRVQPGTGHPHGKEHMDYSQLAYAMGPTTTLVIEGKRYSVPTDEVLKGDQPITTVETGTGRKVSFNIPDAYKAFSSRTIDYSKIYTGVSLGTKPLEKLDKKYEESPKLATVVPELKTPPTAAVVIADTKETPKLDQKPPAQKGDLSDANDHPKAKEASAIDEKPPTGYGSPAPQEQIPPTPPVLHIAPSARPKIAPTTIPTSLHTHTTPIQTYRQVAPAPVLSPVPTHQDSTPTAAALDNEINDDDQPQAPTPKLTQQTQFDAPKPAPALKTGAEVPTGITYAVAGDSYSSLNGYRKHMDSNLVPMPYETELNSDGKPIMIGQPSSLILKQINTITSHDPKPEATLVLAGINDLFAANPANPDSVEKVYAKLTANLNQISQNLNTAHIQAVFATLPNLTGYIKSIYRNGPDQAVMENLLTRVNHFIQNEIKPKPQKVVNLYTNENLTKSIGNKLHPRTNQGYPAIAAAFQKALSELSAPTSTKDDADKSQAPSAEQSAAETSLSPAGDQPVENQESEPDKKLLFTYKYGLANQSANQTAEVYQTAAGQEIHFAIKGEPYILKIQPDAVSADHKYLNENFETANFSESGNIAYLLLHYNLDPHVNRPRESTISFELVNGKDQSTIQKGVARYETHQDKPWEAHPDPHAGIGMYQEKK